MGTDRLLATKPALLERAPPCHGGKKLLLKADELSRRGQRHRIKQASGNHMITPPVSTL